MLQRKLKSREIEDQLQGQQQDLGRDKSEGSRMLLVSLLGHFLGRQQHQRVGDLHGPLKNAA